MRRLILASASPRRRELLEQVGMGCEVIPSKIDESKVKAPLEELAETLSLKKAQEVALREGIAGDIVIGADTIVVKDNQIFGKPGTRDRAAKMLRTLSNGGHYVYTGVTIIHVKEERPLVRSFTEKTKVTLYPISEEEILHYIADGVCLDKAGAYGIQGKFAVFIREIAGDYTNVVGLPVSKVYQSLKELSLFSWEGEQ